MGIYSSFGFPDGVTLFGAGRQFSFDVEEPTFRETEVVIKNEIELCLGTDEIKQQLIAVIKKIALMPMEVA